ncbi:MULTISPECIES: DUF6036 family nucleotidyltransferase [Bacteria]
MNRSELERAIRAATHVVMRDKVIIIGSQSVLGTWDQDELPALATLSNEVDIMPLDDDDAETIARRLDINGELSIFHETHGFYIDGVGRRTATLPDLWEERLVEVPTEGPDGAARLGLCLEPHDLCVAKLVAHRQKDRDFVGALLDADLIDPNILLERLTSTHLADGGNLDYAYRWVLDRVLPREAT